MDNGWARFTMDGVARVRVSRITRRAPCRADNVVISAYGFHGSTCVCHICSRDVDEGLGVSEEDRTREEENSGRSSISTPSYFLHLHPFIRTRDFQRDFQRRSILNLEAGKQVERSFTHRGKPLFPEKRSRRFCSGEIRRGIRITCCFFSVR